MTIRVAIRHNTEYHYDRLVRLSPHLIRLRPAPHCRTAIEAYSLQIEPANHFINWQQDPFGNFLARVVFPERTRKLSVSVEVLADMTVLNPFDFFLDEAVEQYPFAYSKQLQKDLGPYLEATESGEKLSRWLADVDIGTARTIDMLVALNQRLAGEVKYLIRMEPGVQTCEETLARGSGSCRDSAWLLVQILRHMGLAARFVSGYLVQLVADVKAIDGPSGPAQDFTDLHAWAELYLPGAGWVGLDPTSGLFAGEGHIPLACTPEPVTAAAISGDVESCETELRFENRVVRVHEDPRVTKPYSDAQWQAILALGARVDEDLRDGDVRLTMGGEPTFVSIDDMQGAEWNTAALGQHKRRLAGDLLMRLMSRFGPGGLLHFGQGKWYPGEPLPRWALSCFWRADGQPLWQDASRFARPDEPGTATAADARRFVQQLAQRLGIRVGYVVPAFEDVYHYLLSEGQLPANVDPLDNKLDDPTERARLRRLFERGIGEAVGFALPLKCERAADGSRSWRSSPWPFRRERMYLIPGDSPMGLRLPINSLPWEAEVDIDPLQDPFADIDAFPLRARSGRRRRAAAVSEAVPVIKTALCVEIRNGNLCVFLPPTTHAGDFLELAACIEAVAAETDCRVVLEGYEAPRDPRLRLLQVTPDPGVIEVNIHPACDWASLVEVTETLYEQARRARLGTEKFMLDGRHTGTGGGNHVTLGAETPADSPFLRRPHLLKSLLIYWQNHPSLSYLFSGLFIGPTSQAPRVDEARDDNLYELEIALAHLTQSAYPPWQVDRVLRNFLVDLTGNTHRSEFCIDKLYSPSGPAGRRGLVEFRAFEMPPHARMSIVQMLLLRAMVARFWHRPLSRSLVRWGTELHDRFMLPYFVWNDLKLVVEDMCEAGYPLELAWFEPFQHFRFPLYGSITLAGMQLDLHSAIEPWHVLGEESTGQGTARYVDSSLERMQVKVSGFRDDRYAVTCNRRRVPLRETGTRGEFVAGVRYKAWDPPSSMHPTIPVHAPLVFDLVDLANGRSIGGCTYHVSHPGGRNYDTFPVNANEAEARRRTRFWSHGHSQGTMEVIAEEPHPEQPYCLDLRFPPR